MASKPLSGAAKRRKKKDLQNDLKKRCKIDSFLLPAQTKKEETQSVANVLNLENEQEDTRGSEVSELQINTNSQVNSFKDNTVVSDFNDLSDHESLDLIISNENELFNSAALVNFEHPTDRGHYPIDIVDPNMKKFIVAHGSCRPKGPFPRDNKNRCFSASYYNTTNKAGLTIPVTWLCYSKNVNAAYCEVCWLFGDRNDKSYRKSWSQGIQDWQGFSKKITKHARSKCHSSSCIIYEQWKHHMTLNDSNEKEIQKDKKFWREVLKRLVKITLRLACNGQSFRGHNEHIGEVYNGNFLSEVELLAEFDPIMSELLNKPKHSIRYLSPEIQNELITVLSEHLDNQITEEIKSALFYSIIADTTQDISKKDQLSLTIRYAKINNNSNGDATEISITESFVGFFWTHDQCAEGLSNQILEILKKKGISLQNCRGQGYDGASVMSGVYGGVQKRISDEQPSAVYVHCAAHNLNLVVNDAVNGVPEVDHFFTVLQDVYKFFGLSINRWDMLSSVTGESTVTLKKLNPSRWAGRAQSLLGMKINYFNTLKLLTTINLTSRKKEEKDESLRLRKSIEHFEFVFLLVMFSKILGAIDVASKYLQNKNTDLFIATQHLENALETTTNYRLNFDEARKEAVAVASKWGVEVKYKDKRVTKVKRHFGELTDDQRLTDSEDTFRVNIFYRVLDIVNTQLKTRFQGMHDIVSSFSVIFPATLLAEDDNNIVKAAKSLQEKYPDDFSPEFPLQLLSLRMSMNSEIKKITTVKQLADLLIVHYTSISSSYLDVITALIMFLTLPVTVATAERSFSKLKFIKNYLRNSMGQERLSGLALLSIEASRAKVMDVDQLIDRFAEIKSRRKDLS